MNGIFPPECIYGLDLCRLLWLLRYCHAKLPHQMVQITAVGPPRATGAPAAFSLKRSRPASRRHFCLSIPPSLFVASPHSAGRSIALSLPCQPFSRNVEFTVRSYRRWGSRRPSVRFPQGLETGVNIPFSRAVPEKNPIRSDRNHYHVNCS